MYQLTSQEPPFSGENLKTLGHNILYSTVSRIPAIYSERLNTFVQSLLRKTPFERPSAPLIVESFDSKFKVGHVAPNREGTP